MDLRILNCDRNDGNILYKLINKDGGLNKNNIKLIPIDHGLSAPDTLLINDYELCWTNWPQINEPVDSRIITHLIKILKINLKKIITSEVVIRRPCIILLKLSEICLKYFILDKKLNLKEISQIYYRQEDDTPSILEEIITKTSYIFNKAIHNKNNFNKIDIFKNNSLHLSLDKQLKNELLLIKNDSSNSKTIRNRINSEYDNDKLEVIELYPSTSNCVDSFADIKLVKSMSAPDFDIDSYQDNKLENSKTEYNILDISLEEEEIFFYYFKKIMVQFTETYVASKNKSVRKFSLI